MYEIDLTKFNLNLKPFNDKLLEIISRNYGWMNFKKGVFEYIEERDYCIFELENAMGISPNEGSTTFEKDAGELYKALQKSFSEINLSKKKQQALKEIFLEILKLNINEIFILCQISDSKLIQINKYKALKYPNLKRIDDKINKLFYDE